MWKANLFAGLTLMSAFFICSAIGADTVIPVGGNGFITIGMKDTNPANIMETTDGGLINFANKNTVCSVYFKINEVQSLTIALRLSVEEGKSKLRVSIASLGQTFEKTVQGNKYHNETIGTFKNVPTGYVKLDIQGISKTGSEFATISDVILKNSKGSVLYVSDPSSDGFEHGRHGSSVMLSYYDLTNVEYFYNEVMVPDGSDPIKTYFVAIGFEGGYFGMQRTSETERQFLFSIFSTYKTNEAGEIPPGYAVRVLKLGKNVKKDDFGGEGAGQKTFMPYDWKTNQVYKFLVKCGPGQNASKIITAWVRPPKGDWLLMAKIQQLSPTNQYMGVPYSFSENYVGDYGYIERMAVFGPQFAKQKDSDWTEILICVFQRGPEPRDDVDGGLTPNGKLFFLRNCGFFNGGILDETQFERTATGNTPKIDFSKLPKGKDP